MMVVMIKSLSSRPTVAPMMMSVTRTIASDDDSWSLLCYWSNSYSIDDGSYADRQLTMMAVTMRNGQSMMEVTRIDNQNDEGYTKKQINNQQSLR
jgi:hypothetical protein